MSDFKGLLDELRLRAKGCDSQTLLAEKAGWSPSLLSQFVHSEKRVPRVDKIRGLAHALGVDMSAYLAPDSMQQEPAKTGKTLTDPGISRAMQPNDRAMQMWSHVVSEDWQMVARLAVDYLGEDAMKASRLENQLAAVARERGKKS